MSILSRTLARIAPNWRHRWTCPDTIETVAQDFLENHLSDTNVQFALALRSTLAAYPLLAWRRRISSIYGVSTSYAHPQGKPAKPGWNRRLWRNHPSIDPEQLVDRIYDKVIARLQTCQQLD